MPAIRTIARDAAKKDYRLSAFLDGVINSAAFQRGIAGEVRAAETTASGR
jgi:hypothetical protein